MTKVFPTHCFFNEDDRPPVTSKSCGGTITLNDAQQSFSLTSPFYEETDQRSGYISCWWYINCQPGYEVSLKWLRMDTTYEYIYVYDSPSGEEYQVSYFERFYDNISPFVSSRGGITIRMADSNSETNKKTFQANVSLAGTVYVLRHIEIRIVFSCH